MRVSFNGNINLKPNTYSIRNQKGEEINPSSTGSTEEIEINTDKVAYVSRPTNEEGTQLHMINGDIITAKQPFNMNMYNIAQQLGANQTLSYDKDGKVSIFENSIDKLREALKANALANTTAPAADDTPKQTDEAAQESAPVSEVQTTPENNENSLGFGSTYTLNGIEYDVVKMNGFDSLEDFQNFILSKGMTNRGKGGNDWPGQCHNFSCEYGDIMLGTSKIDLNSDDAAAQAKKGRDRQFQNVLCKTHDAAMQLLRGELEEGRPCVVKITKTGENHFGLVCGIRKDADRDNLQNTDFLYIDSYDGKIGQLNGNGYRRLDNWKNGIHIWKSKDYNFSYAVKGEYAKKYTSADEVKQAYGMA